MKKEIRFWALLLSVSAGFIIITAYLLMMVIYPFHLEEIKKRGRDSLQHLQFVLPLFEPVQRQLYLEDITRHNSEFSYLLLMDVNGKAMAHSNPRRVGMVFDELNVKYCIETGNHLEQIYTRDPNNPASPYHNEKTIDIMMPYYASDGNIEGAVSVGISLNAVQNVKAKYLMVSVFCTACWVMFISGFAVVHYRSMSQRQKNEAALFESEERFHTIFNECPIPITLSEVPGGTYVDVNSQYLIGSALGREKVIGETALSLGVIEPAESERIKGLLYVNDKLDNEEVTTHGRSGEPKTSLLSVRFITISGKPFALSMLQDITERKRYEENIARSEANYRNLFENAPIGAFQSTLEGRFLAVNKAFSDMFGYNHPEDVLESITDISAQLYVRKEDRLEMLRQALTSDHITCDDFELFCKNGTSLFATMYMRAVRDSTGQVKMLEGFVVDMTERKRTFDALEESNKLLRLYIERLPIGCIVFDRNCMIKTWNPAAEKTFGYSEQEALGINCKDLIIPDTERPHTDAVWQQLLDGRFDASSTKKNITKDGRTITCEWTNTPLYDNSGNVSGVISVAQDVTEKIHARELLIQHDKMMMIGGLAAGMAHEINNPLSIIIQSENMIKMRLSPSNPVNSKAAEVIGVELDLVNEYMEQREVFAFLANIQRAGERAAKIISNMLAFSRKETLEHRPTDINQVIDRAIELSAIDSKIIKNCKLADIAIVRNYDKNLPKIAVNSTEIEQVMINLLKNAAQAMSDNTTKALLVTIKTCIEGNYLIICVADNGSGMTKEVGQRIFEPFFTTKEIGNGTGLGLYVTYLIITNNHNGKITVESTAGEGTVFYIKLPIVCHGT